MKAKSLVYVCNDLGSVFDSQVLDLIISLNEKKIFEKVYLILGVRGDEERHEFQKRKLPDEIGIIYFRSYPNYPFFNLRGQEKYQEY